MKIKSVLASALAVTACTVMLSACSNNQTANNIVSYVSVTSKQYDEGSIVDLVAEVENTVVAITTSETVSGWGGVYVTSGAGSGVIMATDENNAKVGYIITNNHVIEGAETITVTLNNGTKYDASLVGADPWGDIAVVKITANDNLTVAKWGDSNEARVGETVIAIGNPLGTLSGTVTSGILSAKSRSLTVNDYTMNLLQTDTAINPGNSGGALFDLNANIIGIVNAKNTSSSVEGICFAIPANDARALFTDILDNGYVDGRVETGMTIESSTLTTGATALVATAVKSGSAAESAGIPKNAMIVSIDGKTPSTLAAYNNLLLDYAPGESVEIVYRTYVSQGFFGGWSNETATATLTFTQYVA